MKSKNILILLAIFIITGVLFYTSYNGYGSGHILSYKNIEKGLDLSGGVYIVYEAQEETETNVDNNESTILSEEDIDISSSEEITNEQSSNIEESSSLEQESEQAES